MMIDVSRPRMQISGDWPDNKSNDDADSVTSGAYFDPVDLAPSNWRKAITMGPTFGVALVALATILVNPVIFIAGAFVCCPLTQTPSI